MKNFWLLLLLSFVLGTSVAWTMNYFEYGHREAFFGEIDYQGSVTADNVMEKLAEYYEETVARVEVEGEKNHDFGAMSPGSKGDHEFILKNTGSAPLTLELGATTCKCTLGELENNELAPGDTTKIRLEWKVNVASDKTFFSQSAEVRTNDPLNPAVKLVVSGMVIRDIEFDPKEVTFGRIPGGEPFTVYTKMYSYLPEKIDLVKAEFGSERMTERSEFEFNEVEVSEADGVHKRANQAFDVKATVSSGLRQGPMVTTIRVAFNKLDEDGNIIEVPESNLGDPETNGTYLATTQCAGTIIGSLSMIESSKLKASEGSGGYIWSLGRLEEDDPLTYKAFVVIKGSEADSTNLTIGETYPEERVQAEIGEPIIKKTTRLYPITLKLTANDETVDLLGKNKDDFGWLWIESDNPKVSRMRVAVKVAIEPRP